MADFRELQIHTVYSASEAGARSSSQLRLRVFAVLTILVGLGWLYATWKPAFNWIEHEFMFGEILLQIGGSHPRQPTSAPSVDPAIPVRPPKDRGPAAQGKAAQSKAVQSKAAQVAATRQAQQRLGNITVGWLSVTTLVGFWMVMSGCAALLRCRVLALLGMLLAPMLIGLIIWLVYHVKVEYEWLESILPPWVYPTLAALGLATAVSVGVILQSWGVGLLRIGGVLVILSAIATVAGLWSALRWVGLPAESFTTAFYVKAFIIQSFYGWVLLIGTIRVR